ncbi:MAG: PaaI family thioesterase [Pseudomonadota bacterium]
MSSEEHPFWKAVRGEVELPPAAKLLGWRVLEAIPGGGKIKVQFEATPAFANPMGNIQGGFVSAMLDETVGPALATTLDIGEFAPTVELKTNFIRPCKPGTLIGTGWVVHRGSSLSFIQGELHDTELRLIATATATAKLVKVGKDGFR